MLGAKVLRTDQGIDENVQFLYKQGIAIPHFGIS